MSRDIVLIIGNGLDLHLKLQSKFRDFFEKVVLANSSIYSGNNIIYQLFYYRFFAEGQYDYGSFRRVDEKDPTWMDVEGFLEMIATDKNIKDLLRLAYNKSLSGVNVFSSHSSTLLTPLSNSFYSRHASKSGADSEINNFLLEDLMEFEKSFKNFIKEQINSFPNYNAKKKSFIDKIVSAVDKEAGNGHLRIFNFNYTTFDIRYYVVSNVHGTIDDRVVIGYDSTKNQVEGEIYELSKDWQKIGIDNQGFDLRDIVPDDVVFYGHSLGEQDYPYFFEIFDRCNLMDNKTLIRLFFCYSLFGSLEEQQAFINNYRIAVSNLLNAYERYSRNGLRRNTIVTKLLSQKRLLLLQIDD